MTVRDITKLPFGGIQRKEVFIMEMNTPKNKTVIAILFGGCSTEYEVSLQSAYSVISHLNQEKYEAHLVGITREGTWLCYEGDIDRRIPGPPPTAVPRCFLRTVLIMDF